MSIEFSINAKRIEDAGAKIEVKIHDLTRGDLVGAFAEIFKAQPELRDIVQQAVVLAIAAETFSKIKSDVNEDDDEEGEKAPPQ